MGGKGKIRKEAEGKKENSEGKSNNGFESSEIDRNFRNRHVFCEALPRPVVSNAPRFPRVRHATS